MPGLTRRRIDVGIDVGTRGIGRDLGSLLRPPPVLLEHDLVPSNSQQGSRTAGTVADPPDWNSGSWDARTTG